MQINIAVKRLIFAALVFTTTMCAWCQTNDRNQPNSDAKSDDAFQKAFSDCTFQFSDTDHIKRASSPSNGLGYHRDGTCAYYLDTSSFDTYGGSRTSLYITNKYINEKIDQSGFIKKPDGQWKFKRESFSLGKLLKYEKLNFAKTTNDSDTTLVGRQIEHGTDQTGNPTTFEGVHVLRLSPTYAIAINMPFGPDVTPTERDEVVKDLVQIVNSVKPGGPTAPAEAQTSH